MMDFLFNTAFPAVLNMSLTAIPVILAVLLARLILKHAPKIFAYALWAVVLFRLLCPVSFTADFSLLGALHAPVRESTAIVSTVEYVRPPQAAPILPELPSEAPETPAPIAPTAPVSVDTSVSPMDALTWIWLVGLLIMLGYSTISLLLLHRRLTGAVHLRDNIYLADHAETAFVLGVVQPRIYLPSTIKFREQQYILLHEQQHIRRGDPIWKLLAFLALTIHWFNPLVWVSFILAARDMEMSCDEAVVQTLGSEIRTDYSKSLLNLAAGHGVVTLPLAFGEGDTRSRIKNVLNWKHPRTWVVLLAAIGCIAVVAACGVNPTQKQSMQGHYESVEAYAEQVMSDAKEHDTPYYSADGHEKTATVLDTKIHELTKDGELEGLAPEGVLEAWQLNYVIKIDVPVEDIMLAGGMFEEDGWFDPEGQGCHTLVALRYPDGSIDILHDAIINDGGDFYGLHTSIQECLYDWYVRENHLEEDLPLFLEDWIDQITIPEGGSLGNYPVHRYDGNGWYLYIPTQTWTKSEGYGDSWESAYGTGSQLTVHHADRTAQEEADYLDHYQDGSYWERIPGEIPHVRCTEKEIKFCIEEYYLDDPNGGSWCVRIEWNPLDIAAHGSPYIKMEPDILRLMAESFTVDERFFKAKVMFFQSFWDVRSTDPMELELTTNEGTLHWTNCQADHTSADMFSHLAKLEWQESDLTRDLTGATVTLKTGLWSLTAWEGSQTVRKDQDDTSTWLTVDSDDVFDDPYNILRSWVDEVEYQEITKEEIVIPDRGQAYLEAAAEYAQAEYARNLQPSPGSKYHYAFVKTSVHEADRKTAAFLRDEGSIDENGYPFYATVVFVPENQRALNWSIAGNTGEYTGTDPKVPKDAYEFGRCCIIQKAMDGWHGAILGTGW